MEKNQSSNPHLQRIEQENKNAITLAHNVLNILSPYDPNHQWNTPLRSVTETKLSKVAKQTINGFQRVITLLDRRGHAVFRRKPSSPSLLDRRDQNLSFPLCQKRPLYPQVSDHYFDCYGRVLNNFQSKMEGKRPLVSTEFASSSMSSFRPLMPPLPAKVNDNKVISRGLPWSYVPIAPVPNREHGSSNGMDGHVGSSEDGTKVAAKYLYCKRKMNIKTSITVPAISKDLSMTPSDNYSWKKYSERTVKGSPYLRLFYKCATAEGCPAKKQVEWCKDNINMVTITYEGFHMNHALAFEAARIPTIKPDLELASSSTVAPALTPTLTPVPALTLARARTSAPAHAPPPAPPPSPA
ncbi:hypothetical protein AMTR_s00104p00109130 [Amborella trichopoda]|uniref:WRKY domain-containing protein n=1 Tax=Amborella trichopoda TaxID=13333 RepID=W1NXJ2_AMBTC|nr:hypothetical protein AMTR_s00104p00109130 [Amborella trichopoda]